MSDRAESSQPTESQECFHHSFRPSAGDSAGRSWSGRSFETNNYAGDDGTAPPELLAALAALQAGSGDEQAVVDALRPARVLVPLVAALGEAGSNEAGVTIDKSAELSIVTVAAPDGGTVLPVFASAEAMRRWNAKARPVPTRMQQVALAAAQEGTDRIILDPGSPTQFGLRRPATWAIAQERPWLPPHRNTEVAAAIARGIVHEPLLLGVELAPGGRAGSLEGPELLVRLLIAAEAEAQRDALAAAVDRARHAWTAEQRLAAEVDAISVQLRLQPAAEPRRAGRLARLRQRLRPAG